MEPPIASLEAASFLPHHVRAIETAPAQMTMGERLFLYALTVAVHPERVLEIGSSHGGSAMIITAALDDLAGGRLACVDPQPLFDPRDWHRIEHRAVLIPHASPGAIAEASDALEGRFNLVFIDGDHSRAGVLADIRGLLPQLADRAYLLFHDAHHAEVAAAIGESLRLYPALADCGLISRDRHAGGAQFWGGLYLLQFRV
jgi:predicted O-methyltransferase YrrM